VMKKQVFRLARVDEPETAVRQLLNRTFCHVLLSRMKLFDDVVSVFRERPHVIESEVRCLSDYSLHSDARTSKPADRHSATTRSQLNTQFANYRNALPGDFFPGFSCGVARKMPRNRSNSGGFTATSSPQHPSPQHLQGGIAT
jgi:hypothetical protein